MISSLKTCLIFLALASANLSFAQETWLKDVDEAKRRASVEGKLVLLHFYADWCSPCQQLDKYVFAQHGVKTMLQEEFVAVKIDVDMHPDWVSEYDVKGIPYDVVITPNGNVVSREKCPSSGDKYLAMLQRVSAMTDRIANTSPAVLEDTLRLQEAMTAQANNKNAPVDPTINFGSTPVDFRPSKKSLNATTGQFTTATSLQEKANTATNATESANETSTLNATFQGAENSQPEGQIQAKITKNPFVDQQQLPNATASKPTPERITNELVASKQFDVERREPLFVPGTIQNNDSVKARIRTEPWNQEVKSSQPAAPAVVENRREPVVAKPKYALSGNCPVTLLTESKWVAGNEQWGCTHRGKTYVFANKASMALFMQRPDDYSPVLAGFDPVTFHEKGELVDGKEALGVFMSKDGVQKVVLFVNELTREQFQANPKVYLDSVRIATQRLEQNSVR